MLKAPVAINTSVVIYKHGGVETIDTLNLVGILGAPVANSEWSVGTVALGNQRIAIACLVVGEQIIRFLASGISNKCDIGCIQHIGSACRVENFASGISVDGENNAVVTPMTQIVGRSRPYHLVATTIGIFQIVVRTIDIHTLLAWIIRVVEHIGLAIGDMLPQGQIGVTNGVKCCEFLTFYYCCLLGARCSQSHATNSC